MAAGVTVKLKRKAGAFSGGDLSAGEGGVDTTNEDIYFSSDGSTVFKIGNAAGGGSLSLIDSSVASNDANVLFDNKFTSDFDHYKVILNDIKPVNDTLNFRAVLRTSVPADINDVYDFGSQFVGIDNNSSGENTNNNASNGMQLAGDQGNRWGNAANERGTFVFEIFNPLSTEHKVMIYRGVLQQANNVAMMVSSGGQCKTTAVATGVKFEFASGNISSGDFFLYGVKSS